MSPSAPPPESAPPPPDSAPPPEEETSLHAAALAPQFRSQPRVEWTDMAGTHGVLIDGRVLVGSSPDSGLVVHDPTVSRVHAEFEVREGALWVRDLGSRNGTHVEGLQISGARVPDRGKIRLGAVELVVDYSAGARKPVEMWREPRFGKLVGTSLPMRELFATLARIAPMDASILIQGETGTGKELVARAVHDASPRAMKPFVVVDCAALPENLLDAELFGHVKGAFTGAVGARAGAIESAEGGTVFLDEIGELPMAMQPKLLRVLESRTVRRVGETTHRPVDVRFISATHRDLLAMVGAGEFREDLYFRLSVIPITVPPLRDRKQDIELLVKHFLGGPGGAGGAGAVSSELMRELVSRHWRGNVRELRNFVERARALGTQEALAMSRPDGLPPRPAESASPQAADPVAAPLFEPSDPAIFERVYKEFREHWVDGGEKEYVRRLLLRHQRNVSSAAREAEVDRTYLYRLIRKHDL
jgi:two-component system, NtrC family, response regulator GlrR